MKTLCLDLGTKTGWCIAKSSPEIFESGTENFASGDLRGQGYRFLKFRRWLIETKNRIGGIDRVVYEQVRRHIGVEAAHTYGGFLAILQAFCEHHEIPYVGVSVQHIKMAAGCKGNAKKKEIIDALESMGFSPSDDNEADAIAIMLWSRMKEIPS